MLASDVGNKTTAHISCSPSGLCHHITRVWNTSSGDCQPGGRDKAAKILLLNKLATHCRSFSHMLGDAWASPSHHPFYMAVIEDRRQGRLQRTKVYSAHIYGGRGSRSKGWICCGSYAIEGWQKDRQVHTEKTCQGVASLHGTLWLQEQTLLLKAIIPVNNLITPSHPLLNVASFPRRCVCVCVWLWSVSMSICVSVCVSVCMEVCVIVWVCVFCVPLWEWMSMYECVYEYMCVSDGVCVPACVCVYLHVELGSQPWVSFLWNHLHLRFWDRISH